MKLQGQRAIDSLDAQISGRSEEHKDKSCTHQPYQSPEVFLIDTANHLMQQDIRGQLRDGTGGWYVWGS